MGCGHEMAPQVETPAAPNAPAAKAGDKASVGLCILAVLIPIFGVIYWAIKRKECPKRANACGIAGLASWIFNFIVIMAQML